MNKFRHLDKCYTKKKVFKLNAAQDTLSRVGSQEHILLKNGHVLNMGKVALLPRLFNVRPDRSSTGKKLPTSL